MPIFTEYAGPKGSRGSTVRAWYERPESPDSVDSSIRLDYDPALTREQNHFGAADRLATALDLIVYSNREQLAANLYRYEVDED